ncbi:hypothetical protein T484DRAFT_1893520 [Baffinella frigidus]|nr:hypothetical protein T484DRAFT_1893520 [Cryptophyta sp. CCMP2293]
MESSILKLEIFSTNLDIASKHRQAPSHSKIHQGQLSPGADEKPRPAKHFGASSSSSQVRADAPKPTFSASSKPQATTSGPMRSLTAHKTSAIPPLASGSSAGVSDLKSRVASLATSVRVPLGAHKANLAGNSDNKPLGAHKANLKGKSDNKAGSTIMKPSLPDKTASSTNLENKPVEKPGFGGEAPKPAKPYHDPRGGGHFLLSEANKAVEKPGFGVAPKPVKPGERPAPGAQPTIAKIYRPPSMLHKVQRPAP